MTFAEGLRAAFRGPQLQATLILLVATPLMLVWKYFASPSALAELASGTGWPPDAVGAIGHFLCGFVLMAGVPVLTIVLVFRRRLRDFGLGLGDARRTMRWILFAAPAFILAGYVASQQAEIAAAFPINPYAGRSAGMFALHAGTYLLFYVGWETFFRGFLLFGLRDSLGDASAVLVQVMASSLLHIGSPASETFGAILAGVLWGVCALQTRSVLPGLVQHSLLGISLDAFLCFGGG